MSEDTKTNKNTNARRAILKSMAAGGGAIAAGKMVPEKWTQPVIESVVLPAHAQTSPGDEPTFPGLSGLYNGNTVIAGLGGNGLNGVLVAESKGINKRILDYMVPAAYAGTIADDVTGDYCNSGSEADIAFFVDADTGDVKICISFPRGEGGTWVSQGTSTLTVGGIADTNVRILNFGPSSSVFFELTGMTANADNTITGSISTGQNSDVDMAYCNGDFTASFVGGSFQCIGIETDD